MVFENNSAVAGPVIYASDLDICEWYSRTSPFFSDNNTVVWSFMELGYSDRSICFVDMMSFIFSMSNTIGRTILFADQGKSLSTNQIQITIFRLMFTPFGCLIIKHKYRYASIHCIQLIL